MPVIRVFLVYAHEVARRGVATLLAADPRICVVGEAESVDQARRRALAVRPDLAVVAGAQLFDENSQHVRVRRLLCDLIEQYGRHTSHADLLREALDVRVRSTRRPDVGPSRATTRCAADQRMLRHSETATPATVGTPPPLRALT